MGAGLAFEAASERYSKNDFIALTYHVHIPLPDPMTNPSGLARQEFYAVRSSPSYFIDGESFGGGGGAAQAKSLFEGRIEPNIQKHLAVAPGARIQLRATQSGQRVAVKAAVSKVRSQSGKLRLHVVLAEEWVTYSGENGARFHEMVVRGVAEPAAAPGQERKPGVKPKEQGFALKPGKGGSFEVSFDLAALAADARAHLEDYETNTRKGKYSFREKKHEVDPTDLAVVAFVQDGETKQILQAVHVKPASRTGTH